MKKLLTLICFVACLCVPVTSNAEVSGVYITPKFLMSIMNTGNNSSNISGAGITFFDTSTSYSQFTLGGGLAVGYDFYPQSELPLRAEVELLFRGNQKNTFDLDSPVGINGCEGRGTWNTTTLFANLYYDFHNSSDFTPYIGAGVGLAFNYSGYTLRHKTLGTLATAEQYATNFAWNVGLGCAYSFNENMALDVAYRFMSTGTNAIDGYDQGIHYQIDNNPYGHEFTIGLRMTF